MLLLPLVLMVVVFPGGDSRDNASHCLPSFHVMQISSFANTTSAQHRGSGWLDDLQIQRWDMVNGKAIFLKPWSKGNFSDREIVELEEIFRIYFSVLTEEVQENVGVFSLEYPFEIQGIAGCELHSGGDIPGFLRVAVRGQDFMSFRNSSCVPAPEGGSRAKKFCTLFSHYKVLFEMLENLLFHTCPRFLSGILAAGKADLQRQVKPEAWLSSGSSPGPGRLLLVCHVSGFHPKPMWVMWMRGEQELPGTQPGDVLPHADGTWYLRVALDVAAGEAAGLTCRVKHSSLGGQDLVLYWGRAISTGLIISAVLVPCLILVGFAIWFRRRRSYQDI